VITMQIGRSDQRGLVRRVGGRVGRRVLARAHRSGFEAGLAEARRRRARDRFDYVFVISHGRSGSTLVQGLLNELPGTLVRGENNFFLLHLFHALAAVTDFRRKFAKSGPTVPSSAFYGLEATSRKPFVQGVNDIVTATLLGDRDPAEVRILGFKEVLWHQIEPHERRAFFGFMDRAFPGARYVLNWRETESALGSGFWSRLPEDEARAGIQRVLDVHAFLRETRPDRVFDVPFEVLTAKDDSARELVAGLAGFVLGRPADPALIQRLLERKAVVHGPNPSRPAAPTTAPTDDVERTT